MNRIYSDAVLFLIAGLGLMLLVLSGVVTVTTRLGMRLGKVEPKKLGLVFLFALLQVLLGVATVYAVRAIHNDPWIDIGAGLGMTLLSGLLFVKVMLKGAWKSSLRVWAIAAALQTVLIPACGWVMLLGWVALSFLLYPPQY
jgi:hypothetical protein